MENKKIRTNVEWNKSWILQSDIFQNVGTLEHRNIGTLKCWDIGMLGYWNVGTINGLFVQFVEYRNKYINK